MYDSDMKVYLGEREEGQRRAEAEHRTEQEVGERGQVMRSILSFSRRGQLAGVRAKPRDGAMTACRRNSPIRSLRTCPREPKR